MLVEIKDFYDGMDESLKEMFEKLQSTCTQLGYKIKKDKVKHIAYSFVSSKYKNGIMRFVKDNNCIYLKVKFFGVEDYGDEFEKSLKHTIEEFNFKYTGCYGCGKCKGAREGYIIKYDNGKKYFRCGSEYIDIYDLSSIPTGVIQNIITKQTDYFEMKSKINQQNNKHAQLT